MHSISSPRSWLAPKPLAIAQLQASIEAGVVRTRLPVPLPGASELVAVVAACRTIRDAERALLEAAGLTAAAAARIGATYRGAGARGDHQVREDTICIVLANRRPATLAHLAGLALAVGCFVAQARHLDDPRQDADVESDINTILWALILVELSEVGGAKAPKKTKSKNDEAGAA